MVKSRQNFHFIVDHVVIYFFRNELF